MLWKEGESTQPVILEAGEKSPSFSKEEWRSFIDQYLPNFQGKKDNAAVLLREFAKGTVWAAKTLGIRPPYMQIVVASDSNQRWHAMGHLEGKTYIKSGFLEYYSSFKPDEVRTIIRADGEIAFVGSHRTLFRLAGIEECHHDWYEQRHGKQQGINPLAMSVAEYDARENEFQALELQLKYALERKMPEATIARLRERIANALELRQSKK